MADCQLAKGGGNAEEQRHQQHEQRAFLPHDGPDRSQHPFFRGIGIKQVAPRHDAQNTRQLAWPRPLSQYKEGDYYEENRREGQKRDGKGQGRYLDGADIEEYGEDFKRQGRECCDPEGTIKRWNRCEKKEGEEKRDGQRYPDPRHPALVLCLQDALGQGIGRSEEEGANEGIDYPHGAPLFNLTLMPPKLFPHSLLDEGGHHITRGLFNGVAEEGGQGQGEGFLNRTFHTL